MGGVGGERRVGRWEGWVVRGGWEDGRGGG